MIRERIGAISVHWSVLELMVERVIATLEGNPGIVTYEKKLARRLEDLKKLARKTRPTDEAKDPAVIDHSANAARIGEELRANKLIIFGNPKVGTGLMQSAQTVGIDLPLKFLIWEDNGGQVHITYNSPQYLAERHGIEGQDELLSNISKALSGLAGSAAAK